MEIRLLTVDDAERAVALRRMALTTDSYAFAERLDSDPALNVDFVRQRLADSGIEAGTVVIGAFDPELVGVVGMNRLGPESDGARLWGVYVDPDRRGDGIGRALIDRALQCVRQITGVQHVELFVSNAAAAAIRLYELAGFSTVANLDGKRRMLLVMSTRDIGEELQP
jgi:ribosomal protein S18 acetylase RimI-like enzyme